MAERHVQHVDLAPAFHVLELPHPLLADHVDLERVGGWAAEAGVEAGTPEEGDHREPERDDSPGDLERQ
jgi:hypothetical protein